MVRLYNGNGSLAINTFGLRPHDQVFKSLNLPFPLYNLYLENELVKQCELNERLQSKLSHLEKVHEDRVEGGSNGRGVLPRSEPSNFATLVNVFSAVPALLLFSHNACKTLLLRCNIQSECCCLG